MRLFHTNSEASHRQRTNVSAGRFHPSPRGPEAFGEPAIVPPVTVLQKINSDSILSVEVACEQSRNACESRRDKGSLSSSLSKWLATLRNDYLRGGYSLSYMPLGVIGNVHEKPGHSGRQILPADGTRLVQGVGRFSQLQDSSGTLC